jgi:serine/threonine protein kinase
VLVDSNWVPKIADFGLSTVDVNEMKGMGVGTGRWRAPEVFKNKPKNCQDKFKGFYTNSSDVYSFGVIVWVRNCVCGGVCGVARAVCRVCAVC